MSGLIGSLERERYPVSHEKSRDLSLFGIERMISNFITESWLVEMRLIYYIVGFITNYHQLSPMISNYLQFYSWFH